MEQGIINFSKKHIFRLLLGQKVSVKPEEPGPAQRGGKERQAWKTRSEG